MRNSSSGYQRSTKPGKNARKLMGYRIGSGEMPSDNVSPFIEDNQARFMEILNAVSSLSRTGNEKPGSGEGEAGVNSRRYVFDKILDQLVTERL